MYKEKKSYAKAVASSQHVDGFPLVLLRELIKHLPVDEHRSSVDQVEAVGHVSLAKNNTSFFNSIKRKAHFDI